MLIKVGQCIESVHAAQRSAELGSRQRAAAPSAAAAAAAAIGLY